MYPLVTSPFSCDFLQTQCYNTVICLKYLHSAWLLDGRASKLVIYVIDLHFLFKFKFLDYSSISFIAVVMNSRDRYEIIGLHTL